MKIPVSKIREYPVAVRGIDKSSSSYQNLVESVGRYGVLEPLTVVKSLDLITGKLYYVIIHGLARYHAACDAGVTSVHAYITDMSNAEIELAQLISAIHKIDTKPIQISNSIQRVLARDPLLNLNDMAALVCKTPDWVSERFGISRNLIAKASILVFDGKICLENAYALSKLRPVTEQHAFIDKAQEMQPYEFVGEVMARCKVLKDMNRQAKSLEPISIKILKPKEYQAKHTEIEVGKLHTYIGTRVVQIIDGHHRFAAMCIDVNAVVKIKVVE